MLLDSPERQALIAMAVTDAIEAFCAARSHARLFGGHVQAFDHLSTGRWP